MLKFKPSNQYMNTITLLSLYVVDVVDFKAINILVNFLPFPMNYRFFVIFFSCKQVGR